MPNWKKILTSGSNIQISELTLQAAGVHKASIDTSGNIAAEGDISASSALFGRALTVASAGATKASIDTSGNIASEGYISSSGKLSGTDIDLRTKNRKPPPDENKEQRTKRTKRTKKSENITRRTKNKEQK